MLAGHFSSILPFERSCLVYFILFLRSSTLNMPFSTTWLTSRKLKPRFHEAASPTYIFRFRAIAQIIQLWSHHQKCFNHAQQMCYAVIYSTSPGKSACETVRPWIYLSPYSDVNPRRYLRYILGVISDRLPRGVSSFRLAQMFGYLCRDCTLNTSKRREIVAEL